MAAGLLGGLSIVLLMLGATPAVAKSPAPCGPDDRPEPALQGQVPRAVHGEESRKGFWCNMRRVGHTDIENRGANYNLAWSGDCAYVTTIFAPESEPAGVAVVDVADPRSPKPVRFLTGPGSVNAVEAIDARDAPGRRILVTGAYDEPEGVLEIYDVSADCRAPQLMSTFPLPVGVHNLTLSHDGRTVYATAATRNDAASPEVPELTVVDVSDMAAPKVISTLDLTDLYAGRGFATPLGLHRADVSLDGTRIYVGAVTPTLFLPLAQPATAHAEILILDSSDVVRGTADPQLRVISQFDNGWHGPRRFETGGRTYVVGGDEAAPLTQPASSCEGVWPKITDITDEARPQRAGEFRMEINQTANCPQAIDDNLLYATHYTDVDAPRDTALGLFPMYNSGLRIADLRDPSNPREIGYYNPPPGRDTQFGNPLSDNADVDLSGSNVRYRRETGHIWFVSITGGFHVVELTPTGPADKLGLPQGATPPRAGKRCRLRILVRGPGGRRLRSARIFVNGRLVRSLRGPDLRVPVTLKRLPAGRVRVRIVARTVAGRRVVRQRRYRVRCS